jgi:ribosome-associated translation inhibitor RaiA/cold shock CspA family protein
MQVPLEIAFHNTESSASAEEQIRAHVADLERIFDRVTSCRVWVDQRARNSNDTIPPVVHIDMAIPGHKDVVVSYEPDHLQRKFQQPDLRQAINEAFRRAERQLLDLKEQMSGRTKEGYHDAENQALGQIAELTPEKESGFILTNNGGLLYFHKNRMLSGDFDTLRRGEPVYYVEAMGDTGPIATKVRVKANGNGA